MLWFLKANFWPRFNLFLHAPLNFESHFSLVASSYFKGGGSKHSYVSKTCQTSPKEGWLPPPLHPLTKTLMFETFLNKNNYITGGSSDIGAKPSSKVSSFGGGGGSTWGTGSSSYSSSRSSGRFVTSTPTFSDNLYESLSLSLSLSVPQKLPSRGLEEPSLSRLTSTLVEVALTPRQVMQTSLGSLVPHPSPAMPTLAETNSPLQGGEGEEVEVSS